MAAKRGMASFSIETDQEVLVTFDDGSSERLMRSDLRKHLMPEDCAQIDQAFKVRQSFWRKHLPKGLMVLAVGVTAAMAVMVVNDRPLLHIVNPQKITTSGSESDLQAAHIIQTPAPKVTESVLPSPSVSPVATHPPVQAKGLVRHLTDTLGQMLK
jgi:hypothetical protein